MDIIQEIKSGKLSRNELIEELYWSDLYSITQENMLKVVEPFLLNSDLVDEVSSVLKLYLNPDGAHIKLFEDIIIKLYKKDPIKFIRATLKDPEEGLNVLYIFRNNGVFVDYKIEMNKLIELQKDENIIDEIRLFFKMYDSLCHT